jgi:endo-1,4-beta-xylanase
VGPWLWEQADFRQAVLRDCTLIVPEYEWKWDYLAQRSQDCDLSPLKRYIGFADKNGLAIRGHTLIWHRSMPSWYPVSADRATATKLMTGHIEALVTCAAGKAPYWDVVNEAIEPGSGEPYGLRRTPLLAQIGPDYLDIAFHTAHAADPKARLVYNDYGLAMGWGADRRETALRLLEGMIQRGVPVHSVGIQSHLDLSDNTFDAEAVHRFGRRLGELGLDVMVTELDVSQYPRRPTDPGVDEAVASVYADYLGCMLELPNLKAVSTWGLSDRHSWLSGKADPNRPLLYDTAMRRKPAWQAVARALERRRDA